MGEEWVFYVFVGKPLAPSEVPSGSSIQLMA